MKPRQTLLLFSVLATLVMCKKEATVPLSDSIRHIWIAQTVHENSTLVYTKGAMANIHNYGGYRLDLSNTSSVTLTDVDGATFSGQYELQGDTKLILKNLQPQPTDSGGTLEFTINSATGTALDITRTTGSPKTGGSINQYQLASN